VLSDKWESKQLREGSSEEQTGRKGDLVSGAKLPAARGVTSPNQHLEGGVWGQKQKSVGQGSKKPKDTDPYQKTDSSWRPEGMARVNEGRPADLGSTHVSAGWGGNKA